MAAKIRKRLELPAFCGARLKYAALDRHLPKTQMPSMSSPQQHAEKSERCKHIV
jgi:hypothetical protein